MWELYTFWAFVPVILAARNKFTSGVGLNVPLTSFGIIAPGALACVAGGLLSQTFGAKRIAGMALSLSCLCCLVSPFMLVVNSSVLFVGFMVFWGLVVIADSPLFSTLVAQHAPAESRGTSLTIVNCIGFSITIISIQCIKALSAAIPSQYLYMVLAIGPIFGLIALAGKRPPSFNTHRS
jgi:MFS family permease